MIRLLILLFTLIPGVCFASTQSLIGGAVGSSPGTSTRWNIIQGSRAWSSSEYGAYSIISSAGTISKLYAKVDTAPGAGTSYILTLRNNGTSQSLTCTISDTSTSCTDNSNSFSVSPGDKVAFQSSVTGTPASTNIYWSMAFDSTTSSQSLIIGRTDTGDSSSTGYFAAMGNAVNDIFGETGATQVVPTGGTISGLYMDLPTAPGAGKSWAFTVRKNHATTSLTCTVSGTNKTCNDTSNSFSIAAGDVLSVQVVPSGTPLASTFGIGLRFTSTVDGESINMKNAAHSNSSTVYAPIIAGATYSTIESGRKSFTHTATIKNIYLYSGTAPGSGKSYVFTLRANGADTSLTATLSDANTTVNASTDVSVSQGDYLTTKSVPSGTPASATEFSIGYTSYIAPASTTHYHQITNGSLITGGSLLR